MGWNCCRGHVKGEEATSNTKIVANMPAATAAAAAAATSTFAAIVIIANIMDQNLKTFFGWQEQPLLVLILDIYDKFWSLILARLWKNLSIILQKNFINVSMVFLISENETNYKFGISIKNTIKCHTLKHVFCSISLIFFLSFSIAVSMKFCAVMLLL